MCCHSLLQGIFPTQGSNPLLLHCRWMLCCLSRQESPQCTYVGANSLSLPHPLLPLVSTCLFSMSVSNSCPANWFTGNIFLESRIPALIYIFVFLTHFSLCNRLYVPLHHWKMTQFYSFVWLSNIPLYHNFLIHSSFGGHLGCFPENLKDDSSIH